MMLDTVLLVEDCQATMNFTKFFLTKLGVRNILTASSHSDFKRFLKSETKPNLVVTDWRIDEKLNGGDVVSAVSNLNIPIAIVTSEHSISLDENKYPVFKKPLDLNKFKTWLSKL